MIEETILTKKKFAVLVENAVYSHSMSYIDAIIHICDQRELDPSEISKLISPVIKDKLEAESTSKRLIKGGTASLPV